MVNSFAGYYLSLIFVFLPLYAFPYFVAALTAFGLWKHFKKDEGWFPTAAWRGVAFGWPLWVFYQAVATPTQSYFSSYMLLAGLFYLAAVTAGIGYFAKEKPFFSGLIGGLGALATLYGPGILAAAVNLPITGNYFTSDPYSFIQLVSSSVTYYLMPLILFLLILPALGIGVVLGMVLFYVKKHVFEVKIK